MSTTSENGSVLDGNSSQTVSRDWFPSMDALAKAVGISKVHLKLAKRNGAPGFSPSGRIDFTLFEPWWKENQHSVITKGKDEYEEAKTREKVADAAMAEIALAEMQGKTLNLEKAIAFLFSLMASSNAICKTKMVNEAPGKSLGLDLAKSTLVHQECYDEMCANQQELAKTFLKNKKINLKELAS